MHVARWLLMSERQWRAVEMVRLGEMQVSASTVIGRKIYATVLSGVVAYDDGTRVWEYVDCGWDGRLGTKSCCLINGVLYFEGLVGDMIDFDQEERRCKEIGGVIYVIGGLLAVNHEGNLVMFLEKEKNRKDWEVRIKEVDVKKDKNRELRGDVCLDKAVLVFATSGGVNQLFCCYALIALRTLTLLNFQISRRVCYDFLYVFALLAVVSVNAAILLDPKNYT